MSSPIMRHVQYLLPALFALALGGCATLPGSTGWGGDATLTPGWSRVGNAARTAATDPYTWVPVAAAAALQIGDLDNRISDWANKETPVFGSRRHADDASSMLDEANVALYLGTGLAAPVGGGENWLQTRTKGFSVGAAAIFATSGATGLLKNLTGRTRPLGQGNRSFPSGHASLAGVSNRLTYETLRYYDLAPPTRLAANAGLTGLTLMTGWARVEAGKHHPADVLTGAALGNFLAVFATRAFLDPDPARHLAFGVTPERDGWAVRVSFAY